MKTKKPVLLTLFFITLIIIGSIILSPLIWLFHSFDYFWKFALSGIILWTAISVINKAVIDMYKELQKENELKK